MFTNRIVRASLAVFVLLAMLFSFCACMATPEESFKKSQEAAVQSVVDAIDVYYDKLDTYDPSNMALDATVSVRISDALIKLINTAAEMDLSFINNAAIKLSEITKDNKVAIGLSLDLNQKSLVSANAIMDMATSDIYMAVPVLAEKHIKLNLAALLGEEVDFSNLMSGANIKDILPPKETVKALILKYYNVVMDNITEVTETKETLTSNSVSQECTSYEIVLTEKQAADIVLDVMKAVADDQDIKNIVYSVINYVNDLSASVDAEAAINADEAYNEFISELRDVIAEGEQEMAEGDITDDVMLTWKTYVGKKSAILGTQINYDFEDEKCLISILSAQDGETIGEDVYIDVNGETVHVKGKLTEKDGKLTGSYDVVINNEYMLIIDLADIDTKSLEKGFINGSISLSPSKKLLQILQDELGFDLSVAGPLMSSIALKFDVEQTESSSKMTVGLINNGEEYVAIVIDGTISEGKVIEAPAAEQTTEDILTWAMSVDFNALITALDESDLPDELVNAIKDLFVPAY